MAETLGSLCDKLTIIKLKQWHSNDVEKLKSLEMQNIRLIDEINKYVMDLLNNKIDPKDIKFDSNKVYNKKTKLKVLIKDKIGAYISNLAYTNTELWHEQEKVYDFSSVDANEKDIVIDKIAKLNLERNRYIDAINDEIYSILFKNE